MTTTSTSSTTSSKDPNAQYCREGDVVVGQVSYPNAKVPVVLRKFGEKATLKGIAHKDSIDITMVDQEFNGNVQVIKNDLISHIEFHSHSVYIRLKDGQTIMAHDGAWTNSDNRQAQKI